MGFNLIYWTSMRSLYFFKGSLLEKYGNFGENGRFLGGYGWLGEIPHGEIWLDWGL